jgi:hypothetical protein
VATIEQQAAKAARQAGVDPRLFIALITRGERSHKGWQTSPMGASGPAQLMPGTAASLAKKYKIDTSTRFGNLLGGAYYLAEQLRTFKGNKRLAVAAYNAGPGSVQKYGGVPPFAETQRYVENIFGALGKVKVPGATGKPPPALSGPLPLPPGTPSLTGAPVMPGMGVHATALSNLGRIAAGEKPTDMLTELVMATRMPAPTPAPSGVELVDPQGKKVTRAVKVADPGGGWGGTYDPATVLANVGREHGLTATSEKRDRKTTASGGVSDHWTGSKDAYAYDLGGSVSSMDRAAMAIARRLGVKYNGRGPLVLTKTIGGIRYQVLYRTDVGGNHFDHIHVGTRRVK